jgi:hypothetical protein
MKNTITFIDIDETLFFTKGNILVKDKDGNILKKLTSQEYNTYITKSHEYLDFSEFISTELFINTATPNQPMINILKNLFENTKTTNSEVYLLTARQDFDDKDRFLEFLVKHGIEAGHKDDQKVHVIRAGNIPGFDNAGKKYHIIKKILEGNEQFKTIKLYDDSKANLEAFNELKQDYPALNFEPYIIRGSNIMRYIKISKEIK